MAAKRKPRKGRKGGYALRTSDTAKMQQTVRRSLSTALRAAAASVSGGAIKRSQRRGRPTGGTPI